MKRIINTLLVFSIGLSLGVILQFARASEEQTKAAYLIVSSDRNAGSTTALTRTPQAR